MFVKGATDISMSKTDCEFATLSHIRYLLFCPQ